MANLSQKDLQFCFDELLGELGWGDEVAETGVDPLAWARNEIKDLHKTIKRLRGSLELRNADEQSVEPTDDNVMPPSGYSLSELAQRAKYG